jgi:hypothetical protein
MHKRRMLIAAIILCAVPLSMVRAQREAGSFSIGGFGGVGLPMGGEFFKDYYKMGIGFGGELKYNFSEMSSLVGSFTYQAFKIDKDEFIDLMAGVIPGATVEFEGGDVKTSIISANFLQYFTQPDASAGFYITAGGGYYTYKTDDVNYSLVAQGKTYEGTEEGESESGFGINGGLGLEIMMGGKICLFAQGKYHYTFVEIEGDEEMGIEDTKISFVTIMGGIRITP